jgi:Ca2+-binding EF-hand superfamily protein
VSRAVILSLSAHSHNTRDCSALLGTYNDISCQGVARQKIQALLEKPLNVELLEEMDRDGDGVSDGEFLASMLVAEGLCSKRDTERYFKRFKELDADDSGRLDAEVLHQMFKTMRPAVNHISSTLCFAGYSAFKGRGRAKRKTSRC